MTVTRYHIHRGCTQSPTYTKWWWTAVLPRAGAAHTVHTHLAHNTTFFKTFSIPLCCNRCVTVGAFMLLQWCSWGLGLNDWCPMFWDSVVVPSSGVKISMQISLYFSMKILTLADETTMLSQNVRLQPSNDTAPHPQTAETSDGGSLISHNHLFLELIIPLGYTVVCETLSHRGRCC